MAKKDKAQPQGEAGIEDERKRLQDEKKQLKEQKKEAKRRAREIARQEDDLDEEEGSSGGVVTFLATIAIVVLWVAVICVVIKLDIGGFGSSVLTPILKDVPVVNRILPGSSTPLPSDGEGVDGEENGGYGSVEDLLAQIRNLELELERAQNTNAAKDEEIASLKADVERLREFEQKQVEFQRIRTKFYEEVIYNDKGPGAEAYKQYFENWDPTTAEYLYKQVVEQLQKDAGVQDYVDTFAQMKPKQSAVVLEQMANSNSGLVSRILMAMSVESRAAVMQSMNSDVAAKLAAMMDPGLK